MKRAASLKRQPPQNTPCDACGGRSFKRKTTTFPFPLPTGQTINVAGIQVQECLDCHALAPTHQGKLKLARCLSTFMSLPDKI
jgi:YgiT-type zinc finger domain-containing protein